MTELPNHPDEPLPIRSFPRRENFQRVLGGSGRRARGCTSLPRRIRLQALVGARRGLRMPAEKVGGELVAGGPQCSQNGLSSFLSTRLVRLQTEAQVNRLIDLLTSLVEDMENRPITSWRLESARP